METVRAIGFKSAVVKKGTTLEIEMSSVTNKNDF